MPIVAWYVVSKESYMKRVMSEVFPTDCSPRKTSLNFLSGLEYEPTVVWGCAMLRVVREAQ